MAVPTAGFAVVEEETEDRIDAQEVEDSLRLDDKDDRCCRPMTSDSATLMRLRPYLPLGEMATGNGADGGEITVLVGEEVSPAVAGWDDEELFVV